MIEGIPPRPMLVGPVKPATPARSEKEEKLHNAAGQLEGLFVQQLFKSMRETVPQGEGIVSGGAGEDIFTGLLDQHLAAETPRQWESGMPDALYRQLRGLGIPDDAPAASTEASTDSRSSAI